MIRVRQRWRVRNSCLLGDTLLTLTPEPTVLLLPATVSHHGRLISLPVVLFTTQNTISNPAGVRQWLGGSAKKEVIK